MLPKIETIIYTTDLEPDAPYVFRYALALARQHQAKIIAVHGIEPLTPFGQSLVEHYVSHETTEEMHSKARESVKDKLQTRIQELCATECNNVPSCEYAVSSIQVLEGQPSQVILEVAEANSADLIVMGERDQSIISKIVMGSTTRKVLHSASQPVFVVKIPKGFKE